jgi:hypothetical protein
MSASGLGLRGKTAYTSPSGSGVLANGNYAVGIRNWNAQFIMTITGGTGYIDAMSVVKDRDRFGLKI